LEENPAVNRRKRHVRTKRRANKRTFVLSGLARYEPKYRYFVPGTRFVSSTKKRETLQKEDGEWQLK